MPKKKERKQSIPPEQKAKWESTKLRELVEAYYDIQDVRMQTSNRVQNRASKEILEPKTANEISDLLAATLKPLESNLQTRIMKEVKNHVAWEGFLSKVYGIGPCLAGGIISWIGDVKRFETVSKLWRYFGLAVINGKSERLKAGEKIHYNPKCKILAWKVGQSFVKVGKAYRGLYDNKVAFYKAKGGCGGEHEREGEEGKRVKKPCVETGHIHNMAIRAVVKIFLQHVWCSWREIEGLPVTEPYPIAKLGHTTYYRWQDFLEKEKTTK